MRIHIDDARHYLLTTTEKFDAITSDPLDPWVKGAATLYTREFFEAARHHLNPGGVVTLFVQLYDSSPASIKSEVATFFDVFRGGIIAGNTFHGIGYDTVLLGQADPGPIDLDAVEGRLQRPDYRAVAASLREIGIASAVDLFATYAGRAVDVTPWTRDASINLDSDRRLQYLAGLGLNMNESDAVCGILKYAAFGGSSPGPTRPSASCASASIAQGSSAGAPRPGAARPPGHDLSGVSASRTLRRSSVGVNGFASSENGSSPVARSSRMAE